MKRKSSLYQLGGLGFAIGAVLFSFSVLRSPVPPTAPPLSAADLLMWKLTTLALFGGAALTLTGQLTLARHWAGTEWDGWGLLAVGAGVIGAVGYVGASAAQWVMYGVGVSGGLTPEMWGGLAMAAAGRIVAWSSVIAGGVALTSDPVFPKWLGLLGIVIGAGEIIVEVLLESGSTTMRWLWLVGFAWLFVLGLMLVMMRTALAAGVTEPAVVAKA